ncbi:MAG: polyhydroxybutyrate depolymerase, partial [Pseudomonadota bacterium]
MRFLILLLLLLPFDAMAQTNCTGQTPCVLGERSYHVREPDGWDGVTPMPVMLHFHGWARQGTLVVKHGRIATATAPKGVLLLAPNGRRKTWDFWSSDSADVPFARAVLEDAAKRYPIDPENIFISGYSFGSAMAWRFVCEDGADIKALLAVAGTLRQDEACPTHPKQVRH